ncbi:MAG: molybdopterin molybdotransferase MoeA [bacterium]|nr:molybdopterin molybdotransferase MoeA [bacterium]
MISFREAQAIIFEHIEQLPREERFLSNARNFFLAEELRAPFPIPRFDHSAVDGFAIRSKDIKNTTDKTPVSLRVINTVKTGQSATDAVYANCAIRIFTGATLPQAADTVVMVEDVVFENNTIRVSAAQKANKNIRRVGEEFAKDAVCLPCSTRLTPAAIGLAATLGMNRVQVHRKPRVAVLITGSELVEPGMPLSEAQIYDSNRFALVAALSELGIEQVTTHTCQDDRAAIRLQIESALREADIVITSGGASVGDVDYVKPAILELGGTIHFDKVAIKPGKPTVFATVSGKPVFGLPGNPVSALVTYLLFVMPALLKMLGDVGESNLFRSVILNGTLTKRSSRTEFVRAKLSHEGNNAIATPCIGQESHMLGGLVTANSLIVFEGEAGTLPDRNRVPVLPIQWS